MAPRRYYAKQKKTYAKGQDFELRRKDRYLINVSLVSIKTRKDYDIASKTGEFYLKIGEGIRYVRAPNKGYIQIHEYDTFDTGQSDFSLYTEFLTLKRGDKKEREVRIRLFERDVGKKDDLVFDKKIKVKLLTSDTKYLILEDDDKKTKVKIKVRAAKTKF
ncbi:MAG: hypothetical protein ACTSRG_14210 [Candidatus Helarchaeota archaeon]